MVNTIYAGSTKQICLHLHLIRSKSFNYQRKSNVYKSKSINMIIMKVILEKNAFKVGCFKEINTYIKSTNSYHTLSTRPKYNIFG